VPREGAHERGGELAFELRDLVAERTPRSSLVDLDGRQRDRRMFNDSHASSASKSKRLAGLDKDL
jgi:hypothetical protein